MRGTFRVRVKRFHPRFIGWLLVESPPGRGRAGLCVFRGCCGVAVTKTPVLGPARGGFGDGDAPIGPRRVPAAPLRTVSANRSAGRRPTASRTTRVQHPRERSRPATAEPKAPTPANDRPSIGRNRAPAAGTSQVDEGRGYGSAPLYDRKGRSRRRIGTQACSCPGACACSLLTPS